MPGLALLTLTFILLSGCLQKRIVWSPDGRHAAVIGEDGLYLADAAGHLTPLLVPGVHAAAWLDDSTRLVLARTRKLDDWTAAAKLLSPERAAALADGAEAAWRQVQGGAAWSGVMKAASDRANFFKTYLGEKHGTELRAQLTNEEWADVKGNIWEADELVAARVEGESIVVGTPLHEGLGGIWDIRPSHDGRAVAFTVTRAPESGDNELLVTLLDASMAPVRVAVGVAVAPDWTADGRALVDVEAALNYGDDAVLRLGAVAQRQVFDAAGHLAVVKEPQYLAGVVFNDFARVRCLRDGRILFNSAEFTLPLATAEYGHQRDQLFALDPARQSTLVRLIPQKSLGDLPGDLGDFEVSPDEKRVLFGGNKGDVCVLNVATGEVLVVQRAGNADMHTAPVWRSADDFTYEKRVEPVNGKTPARPAEIVLHGANETMLSAAWSDDLLKGLLH